MTSRATTTSVWTVGRSAPIRYSRCQKAFLPVVQQYTVAVSHVLLTHGGIGRCGCCSHATTATVQYYCLQARPVVAALHISQAATAMSCRPVPTCSVLLLDEASGRLLVLHCSALHPCKESVFRITHLAPLLSIVSNCRLLHPRRLVNSAVHVWGSRDYETDDDSRNNMLVALLVFGDGRRQQRLPRSTT